jgi:hypothetical protein
MEGHDDELRRFEATGATPLPLTDDLGYIENDGARIWYSAFGSGAPVILLHGGLGHSGNWGYQVPALIANGYRAVVIDSRGHGRSTRDGRPYSYELMASDVLAVMNALHLRPRRPGGLERRRVHRLDSCSEIPWAHCGRVLFCLQYGSDRV